MKVGFFKMLASLVTLTVIGSCLAGSSVMAASAAPALLKAKQEAEAKGYIFEINRDDIVAKAKKEGKLKVFSSLDAPTIKALNAAATTTVGKINGRVVNTRSSDFPGKV